MNDIQLTVKVCDGSVYEVSQSIILGLLGNQYTVIVVHKHIPKWKCHFHKSIDTDGKMVPVMCTS